ncbi:UNVERIFIED_CONTAM: hypothetical protein NCL1_28906 [Trichonephila clavipes]
MIMMVQKMAQRLLKRSSWRSEKMGTCCGQQLALSRSPLSCLVPCRIAYWTFGLQSKFWIVGLLSNVETTIGFPLSVMDYSTTYSSFKVQRN